MKKGIKERIPKIHRTVEEFVKDESGAVTKSNILKTGIALGVVSLALMGSGVAEHTSHRNTFNADPDLDSATITAKHTHHGSHSSY